MTLGTTPLSRRKWLNRNVVGMVRMLRDSNYEMILAVLPLFITVGLGPSGSLVEHTKLGTAHGVLNGINGAGDLGSSVIAGLLWTANPAIALGFGAALSAGASVILWSRPPRASN